VISVNIGLIGSVNGERQISTGTGWLVVQCCVWLGGGCGLTISTGSIASMYMIVDLRIFCCTYPLYPIPPVSHTTTYSKFYLDMISRILYIIYQYCC